MQVIRGRNVNDLFIGGVRLLREFGQHSASRGGDVLVMPWPVTSVYSKPCERVLLDPRRDANPFFHLMESLWMLAGRDDAEFLNRYVKDFGDRFAEPDGHIHGAYGKRWRHYFYRHGKTQIDQLREMIEELKRDPLSRRTVIQMWDAPGDLGVHKKDIPCNTHIYLRVRFDHTSGDFVLDITVCCRSNDIIWGAYGANAVHFSVLHEYLAAGVGVQVGTMYQISNNFHAYCDVLDKQSPSFQDAYVYSEVQPSTLVHDFRTFDEEVLDFCDHIEDISDGSMQTFCYENKFLVQTAAPMTRTHWLWRRKNFEAAEAVSLTIQASDWRLAARLWMQRRMK